MSFLELVHRRRSVRSYLDKPVPRESIEQCLEASRLAPSACNSQPWHFIVVDDPHLKGKVAEETYSKTISFNQFVPQAPVIVAIIGERAKLSAQLGSKIKNKQYSLMDVGIAADHFCLQATEMGLGTCILGWFNERNVKKLLGVPRRKRVLLLIAVGYPRDNTAAVKTRKSLEEMRSYNRS